MESLDTIQGQIKRHLNTQHLKQMSDEFRALNSNSERVFYAYKILGDLKLFPDVVVVEKCDDKSVERRNYGNHVFMRLKKFSEAVKHYNKAIAYAKSPEKLAISYGNRSAVYYQNNYFKSCLEDINNALKLNPPIEIAGKLVERKKRALEKTVLEDCEEYFLGLPEIPDGNPVIECASSCVEIQCSDDLGRYVRAKRDITPGEVIAVEAPYINVLLYDFYLSHCHKCLKPARNLIPCEKCPLTLYCGEECRKIAWEYYHQYECPILDTLHSINATKLQLLALRIVLTLRPQITANFYPLGDVYKSGNYAEIHNLITNENLRTISDLFARATVAAILLYLLEKTPFFDGCPDLTKARENCALLLLKHLQTAPSNMHEISELQGRPNTGYEITEIGAGAYGFLSLLNHSCYPNVVRHCHGSVVVLRAVKSIKFGEQLYDNYGYHFALMEKSERKSHLKDQYLFDCDCEACINDYPLYTVLSKGNNNFIVSENELNDLLNGKRETAIKLLPILLNNAREFEKEADEKRVEILDNQEVMKQCFAILGNKYTFY